MKKELNIRDFADKVCEVKDKVIKIQEHITNIASEMKVECEIDNIVHLNNEDNLNLITISIKSDVNEFLSFVKNYINQYECKFFSGKVVEDCLFLTIKIL